MKSIYTRNLIKWYFSKKKMIICCLLVSLLLFGILGVRQAYPEKVPALISEEAREYEVSLQEYDEAIATLQENVATTKAQVEDQQKYCDESVYMQMDASNIQQVTTQYNIKVSNNEIEAESLMNSWISYINSGSLKSELAEKMDSIPESYLSELVSASASDNILVVVCRHYDMEQAVLCMQVVQDLINAHVPVIQNSFGGFEMEQIDYAEMVVADSNVQDAQNAKINNLKYFKTSLTELQDKLVTMQTNRDEYVKQYKPVGVSGDSSKKTVFEYLVLGILAGILVPFVVVSILYTVSGRVKNKEELLAAELNVLTQYNVKKKYEPNVERTILNILLLARQRNTDTIFVSSLGKSKHIKQVETDLADRLRENSLKAVFVEFGEETEEQLKSVIENGEMVLLVETGLTTYAQLEEQMQFCKRFKISVWGCIVIE